MKHLLSILLFAIIPFLGYAQRIEAIVTLHDTIKESSGIIYLDNRIITHNDSKGEPALFEVDPATGNINRKVIISNAQNIDWEDLCHDDKYIYIGDFGNNLGNRTNLKIYRILISDYLTTANNTVEAESIQFAYADQKNFSSNNYNTNFDAEAFISLGDSLYIFTKNWKNFQTNIYPISKKPGNYQISKIDSLNVQGLITGAAYEEKSGAVMLTGYSSTSPFIIKLSGFIQNKFSSDLLEKHDIKPQGSYQIEGIAPINVNQYYLTSEENAGGKATLYKLTMDIVLGIGVLNDSEAIVYPNPANEYIHITHKDLSSVEFYNSYGKLIKISGKNMIRVSDLKKGIYILLIKSINNDYYKSKKLIIK